MKNFRLISLLFIVMMAVCISHRGLASDGEGGGSGTTCGGKFPNPVTDICWACMFPINIGPVKMNYSPSVESSTDDEGDNSDEDKAETNRSYIPPRQIDNRDPQPPLLCACPAPPPIFVRPGVGVSFWEPVRLVEVVRTPLCSPTLNGTVLGSLPAPAGTHYGSEDVQAQAFYHVHWIVYPVLSWLGTALCASSETFDLAYLTEIDPLWNDDELAFLLNPEAILFANPIAQAACVADSISAATTMFGLDLLFWCSGSTGSVYPLTGNYINHIGGVDTSLNLVHRMAFKLHRQFLAKDTSTLGAMCAPLPQPIMRKNQYKQQMMYPIPQTSLGMGFGVPSAFWAAGREFPYKGEDFSYLIWRKRTCCAL